MAVQGDVSLMFVMDDTGSMGREIEAVKSMAIDIMNYERQAPINLYILSPFNDPYPSGKSKNLLMTEQTVLAPYKYPRSFEIHNSALWTPHFTDSSFYRDSINNDNNNNNNNNYYYYYDNNNNNDNNKDIFLK